VFSNIIPCQLTETNLLLSVIVVRLQSIFNRNLELNILPELNIFYPWIHLL
jgi:hypothetical protein